MSNNTKSILGIDVSKRKLDVALMSKEKTLTKQFDNSKKGFGLIRGWLLSLRREDVHVCLESTGVYGEKVAEYLHENGYQVSVVNPLRIKRYAESKLSRNKTDKVDARIIADFCLTQKPEPWTPPSKEFKHLQSLTRRIESLEQMLVMEQNRLESATSKVTPSIRRVITSLEEEIKQVGQLIKQHFDDHPGLKEQKDLLETIPGIGEKTANMLLSELEFNRYSSARQVAAQAGVTPKNRQSGSSLNTTSLSRLGNSRIRKGLYFPAIVAKQYNQIVKQFATRLEKRGKSKMQIICASIRKLIHIAFGVLKHKRPFDPTLAFST